jgi:hypothetical protein
MAKVIVSTHEDELYVRYECPGCKHQHFVPAKRWNFNGNIDHPTLSPSVRHFIPASEYGPEKTVCHYFVRDGWIEYCGDCDHSLSGQRVELPEIKDE